MHFKKNDPDFSNFQTDTSIASFGDPDLALKLDSLTFFFMVDMEQGVSSLDGWDLTSQTILRDYVFNGGNIVMVSKCVRLVVHLLESALNKLNV